jgi:sugar O-acyltransferase (sialic acid O-acetyltransferase NeuD family)
VSAQRLLIIGAGGSGREVAWLARDVYGDDLQLSFAVEPGYLTTGTVDDIPVFAFDAELAEVTQYVIAIGNLAERRRLAAVCDARGWSAATLVHPSVCRSSRVEVGAGSIVCAGAILTTNVRIDRHVHVNIGCTLSHDVQVGDFATLSPAVHLSGHVHVEEDVFLGAGANVINGTTGRPLVIGRGATVAAGACVIRSVEPGAMVVGVPAVQKR